MSEENDIAAALVAEAWRAIDDADVPLDGEWWRYNGCRLAAELARELEEHMVLVAELRETIRDVMKQREALKAELASR